MIRHAVTTMSATAVLALTAAAPAVACTNPPTASNPQAQPGSQVQQVHAQFAGRGYGRHWHHHHHYRGWQNQQSAPSSRQQSTQSQDQSSQSQPGGNCDHS
jgi:hypothetical protein